MSDGCLRCGSPGHGGESRFDQAVSRSYEPGWRHWECELRRRWEEWKETVADMNGVEPEEVSFSGGSNMNPATEGDA